MRRLLEAVLAFSDHFGEQIALDLEEPIAIADILDTERDGEFIEEILQHAETLRHQLGGLSATARLLNNMVKYGEDHWKRGRKDD